MNRPSHPPELLLTENSAEKPSQSRVTGGAKLKLALFCLPGLDNFVGHIVDRLSSLYEVKSCVSTDANEIRSAIEWADLLWLEWANELAVELTGQKELLQGKKVICRLHSYEAFSGFMQKIAWSNVQGLIFVAGHIKEIVLEQAPAIANQVKEVTVIPNGIDLNLFNYKKREKGFDLCYVGHLNYKKGPMLLLHALHELVRRDGRYQLHIAGEFQDLRYQLYFQQMIKALNLEGQIYFSGWIDNVSEWLEDKQYIVSSSVLEGHPVGLMEAMARGIRPLIHNFYGAGELYPADFIWNTVHDFADLVMDDRFESLRYRQFVEDYSIDIQMSKIESLLSRVIESELQQEQPVRDLPAIQPEETGKPPAFPAMTWISRNRIPGQGIGVPGQEGISNAAATACYVPSLLKTGERELALQLARWLVSIQRSDGSVPDTADEGQLALTTAQVLRSLAGLAGEFNEFLHPVEKAYDWLVNALTDDGRFSAPEETVWSLDGHSPLSETIHVTILPALKEAGGLLKRPEYSDLVGRSLNYYIANCTLTSFKTPDISSHCFAGIQEALLDLGEVELATKGMESVARYQWENGGVPAYHHSMWICSAGLARLTALWYRLGEVDRAGKAMRFLETLRNSGGGFYKGYGVETNRFFEEESPVACKYDLEANHYAASVQRDDQERPGLIDRRSRDKKKPFVLEVVYLVDSNFGDILIYETIDYYLKEAGFHTDKIQVNTNIHDFVRIANQYDFVYFVGGGIIERSAPPVIKNFDLVHSMLKVPYGIVGLSTGSFDYSSLNKSLKIFCENARFFYTRDEVSVSTFLKAGSRIEPKAGVDVVFANPFSKDLRQKKRSGVRASFRNVPYVDMTGDLNWVDWSRRLREISVKSLIYDCSDAQKKLRIPVEQGNVIDQIADSGMIVAMRFHVILVASLLNIPTIAISYCPKVQRLTQQLGIEEYCLDIHQSDKLVQTCQALEKNKTSVLKSLKDNVQACQSRSKSMIMNTVEIIKEL